MTLRRLMIAGVVLCGLCVWGFAYSDVSSATADPVRVRAGTEAAEGGNHDEAEARWRSNQSRHWRHVAIGNRSTGP
jgi:hypothetical protein